MPPVVQGVARSTRRRQATPERTDRVYDRIAQMLARTRPAQVTLTRYQSLDTIGHYFLRYADAVGIRRRHGRRAPAIRSGARASLRDHRRGGRPGDGGDRPRRSAAGRVRLRHGAAGLREAADRAGDRRSRPQRHARRGAGRVPHGVWRRWWRKDAGCRRAPRFVDVCRRSCISSGCRSAATWTATPRRICFSDRSRTSGRSPSSPRTTDDVARRSTRAGPADARGRGAA